MPETSGLNVSTPTIVDSLNTCDGVQPKFFRPVSTPDRFILDPGNGSGRFTAKDLGTVSSKMSCVIAVKFNVPANFRAKMHLSAALGQATLKSGKPITFDIRSGFSNNKPLTQADLNTGPSLIEQQFLSKDKFGDGKVDVQVDKRDGRIDLVVSECGQRGVWFHSTQLVNGIVNSFDIDLGLIHSSFDLERCP